MFDPTQDLTNSIDIVGKSSSVISTQLFGNPSNFRELASQFNITPFDPQSKIDEIGKLDSVKEVREQVDELIKLFDKTYTSIKQVPKDIVNIDWLMN